LSGGRATLKRQKADFEIMTDIALSGRAQGRASWAQFKSDASDDALRSNIRVFLAGAMEATTSFASWALSHLSRRPDIQDKIYEEVRHMSAYDPDNLAEAVTLNRVLEETLRLTPALYFLPRSATSDTWVEINDGRRMLIPKGTTIRLDVWHANRCEEFWGKEVTGYPADVFAPERWEVLAEKGTSSRDLLHFGFGHGARVCPGKFLGRLEVGLVVGAIVKVFKLAAVNERTQAKAGVSTKPGDGVLVDLELR
jgi:cytochrome P450